LRQKNTVEKLEEKTRIAEESFDVAQTAFQALAVTEKMTRDAFSLERILKIGVLSLFGLALRKPSVLTVRLRNWNIASKLRRSFWLLRAVCGTTHPTPTCCNRKSSCRSRART
jgi:hypothetical protein